MAKTSPHGGKRTLKAALSDERTRAERLAKLVEDSNALLARLEGGIQTLGRIEAELKALSKRVDKVEGRFDEPTPVAAPATA